MCPLPPAPASEPHLRGVLAAAAITAGLSLADFSDLPSPTPSAMITTPDGVMSDAEARLIAASWPWGGVQDGSGGPGTVVVLVDGLGWESLAARKGHAPTLRAWINEAASLPHGGWARTCLPSTTAAALTTLGTGALPGLTGMVGYSVWHPKIDRASRRRGVPTSGDDLCLITWERTGTLTPPDPRTWQNVPTIFERLRGEAPTLAVSVGPARFAGSGLTEAGLRGAVHLAADLMEDRPALVAGALRRGVPLAYLYVGELDHAGHGHGWNSQEWLAQLERLDAMLARLTQAVPRGTRIILTADHGMIDTDAEHRVVLTEYPQLMEGVIGLAGEPRFSQLYVPASDPQVAREVAARWRDFLGERASWVGTREEASALLGPVGERARSVLGDVLVAMEGQWVVVDPRVHSEAAMDMPGVHGSLTESETAIPLLFAQA